MITEQRLQEIAKLRAMVSTKALRDATADGRLEEQLFAVGAPNVIDELIAEVRRLQDREATAWCEVDRCKDRLQRGHAEIDRLAAEVRRLKAQVERLEALAEPELDRRDAEAALLDMLGDMP
jgi:predicted  nucleic acid-binding Zn-ribbon protein